MNEKQQQLTFDKGITNVPSDALCSDNALEESLGMVYDDGEHRVIQRPADFMTTNGTLVFAHTVAGITRYVMTSEGNVYWNEINDAHKICSYRGELRVSAIGATLVLAHSGTVIYAKWVNDGYTLISGLPEFQFFPAMLDVNTYDSEKRNPNISYTVVPLNMDADYYGITRDEYFMEDDGTVHACDRHAYPHRNVVRHSLNHNKEKNETWQNEAIGIMEEYIKNIHRAGAFVFPFWVRFALVLYDGSITRHSAPILMWPSVRYNCCLQQTNGTGANDLPTVDYGNRDDDWFKPVAEMAFLHFRIYANDIDNYSDIISGIKVYVTPEVRTSYLNENNWAFYSPLDDKINYKSDYCRAFSDGYVCPYERSRMDTKPNITGGTGVKTYYKSYFYPQRKSDDEIISELISACSNFRELCEVPFSDIMDEIEWYDGSDQLSEYQPGAKGYLNAIFHTEELMAHEALNNITTQTQMPQDDYFSHSEISGGHLYAYNNRMNIYNFSRKLFQGFTMFSAEGTNVYQFHVDVQVKTNHGDLTTYVEFSSNNLQGQFFYYPDPRATKATMYIKKNNVWYLLKTMNLIEHPHLHGAYYFKDLPRDTGSVYDSFHGEFNPDNHYYTPQQATPPDTKNDMENIEDEIMTSEVNNPFAFYAEGSNTIGSGKIIGLATQTVALSSGTAFGAQPLIVFTNKGLWSMTVDATGLFKSTAPMPREVCNNERSITETDGAVFFSSEKGLMVIVGSQVKCVSEQLSGYDENPFAEFLKSAFIAYDYRDSLLWIFDGHKENGAFVGSSYCWNYSIKSGTFGRFDFGTDIVDNLIDNYPDYLLQSGTKVMSLINRPNINLDDYHSYEGSIITRPMKLENALALKSIMQIRHILRLRPYTFTTTSEDPETHETVTTETTQKGTMTLRIFASNNLASNNLDDWAELHSLRGTPWKYYKFQYDFANMKATDRFAGTMLITQERRTNKLR